MYLHTKFNDVKISNTTDLRQELYKYQYGDKVKLTYFDGTKYNDLVVKLAKNNLR